jgi:hypothetical protein
MEDKMVNDDFNKMLNDYMSGIRRKNSMPFSNKIKRLFKSKPGKKIQLSKNTAGEYIEVTDERLETPIIENKKGFFSKFLGLFSVKHKEIPEKEFETVYENPKKEQEEIKTEYEEFAVKEIKENFISRLFKKMFYPKKKDIEEPELKTYSSELDEDVVKVLNIVNLLFKKLPQNVKQDFKNSEDFEVYANILKKYHIIKKP